jgi:hypothetical protein
MKESMKKPLMRGHTLESPFPFKLLRGGVVVDEMCTCGMKRSEHADTAAFGHGALMEAPNRCRKFTWVKFITID